MPVLINHLTWIDAPDATTFEGSLALEIRRRLEAREKIETAAGRPAASSPWWKGSFSSR
jgi:hypothetical protein